VIRSRARRSLRRALTVLPLVGAIACAPPVDDPDPPANAASPEAGRLSWPDPGSPARIENGWFVQDGRAIWGYAQHNGWWAGFREGDAWWATYGVRTNITRRAPGQTGPGLTEDLDRLTDAMIEFGYPGFEHNFGLWYDRRRDAHDVVRRDDAEVVGPFLEQPWARSDRGTAWDGLPLYDLERFNPWYFERLREFAAHSDRKGAVFIFNFYMQHALLEQQAHYADFPWRPVNAIQDTGMPDQFPAANAFYDVEHPVRRRLHRAYIRKCLDELGEFRNVVFLTGMEYTGPLPFTRFWLDTVHEWEQESRRKVLTGIGATKDVLDDVLSDPDRAPRIAVIDLRYWFYEADGKLRAPAGGQEMPGRYAGGGRSRHAPPELIYEQVSAYRHAFPQRAILHTISADRKQTWAFFMAGGSMLVRPLGYAPTSETEPWKPPEEYVAPGTTPIIMPLYRLLTEQVSPVLRFMRPVPERVAGSDGNVWALENPGLHLLVYALEGGRVRTAVGKDAEPWVGNWVDPRTGDLQPAMPEASTDGAALEWRAPGDGDWALWLARAVE
jgi:hypothetical protein